MLEEVKKRLGITGDYQDDTIQGYIDDVKQFLLDGGVNTDVVNASSTVGVIARGVSDLWNYGSKDSSDIEKENTNKNNESDKGDKDE